MSPCGAHARAGVRSRRERHGSGTTASPSTKGPMQMRAVASTPPSAEATATTTSGRVPPCPRRPDRLGLPLTRPLTAASRAPVAPSLRLARGASHRSKLLKRSRPRRGCRARGMGREEDSFVSDRLPFRGDTRKASGTTSLPISALQRRFCPVSRACPDPTPALSPAYSSLISPEVLRVNRHECISPRHIPTRG